MVRFETFNAAIGAAAAGQIHGDVGNMQALAREHAAHHRAHDLGDLSPNVEIRASQGAGMLGAQQGNVRIVVEQRLVVAPGEERRLGELEHRRSVELERSRPAAARTQATRGAKTSYRLPQLGSAVQKPVLMVQHKGSLAAAPPPQYRLYHCNEYRLRLNLSPRSRGRGRVSSNSNVMGDQQCAGATPSEMSAPRCWEPR